MVHTVDEGRFVVGDCAETIESRVAATKADKKRRETISMCDESERAIQCRRPDQRTQNSGFDVGSVEDSLSEVLDQRLGNASRWVGDVQAQECSVGTVFRVEPRVLLATKRGANRQQGCDGDGERVYRDGCSSNECGVVGTSR